MSSDSLLRVLADICPPAPILPPVSAGCTGETMGITGSLREQA